MESHYFECAIRCTSTGYRHSVCYHLPYLSYDYSKMIRVQRYEKCNNTREVQFQLLMGNIYVWLSGGDLLTWSMQFIMIGWEGGEWWCVEGREVTDSIIIIIVFFLLTDVFHNIEDAVGLRGEALWELYLCLHGWAWANRTRCRVSTRVEISGTVFVCFFVLWWAFVDFPLNFRCLLIFVICCFIHFGSSEMWGCNVFVFGFFHTVHSWDWWCMKFIIFIFGIW